MSYRARLADTQLDAALARAGAVLVEGPKACGKTETAIQRAKSSVRIDVDPTVPGLVAVDPMLVLEGPAPRLLDEWQVQPSLWNAVRRAVDDSRERGGFILTGSTAPAADAVRHSGAGRIARVRMRTMAFVESGESDGRVSLAGLLEGDAPRSASSALDFDGLIRRIARGGWPGFLDLDDAAAAANVRDYAQTIASLDLGAIRPSRDPARVTRLMRAVARSVATEVTISTLARDEADLSRDSVRDYLSALARIFIVEDQPAWSAHLRSSAALRKEPKRHLADPSLALALVGGDAAGLRRDPAFAGQLFESQVVHDLRVLSDPLSGEVFHARDSAGREVDAIIQRPSGQWAAFEVKLGSSAETVDLAARSLRAFAAGVDAQPPSALTVVTGSGPSYRRDDGVNVVALGALGP